ncbi:MAG: nucleotidyltransferase family protein [Opitutaceae bacterium]|nr:nucleotidyltransferase family protein [Opitutaceae bacterium]
MSPDPQTPAVLGAIVLSAGESSRMGGKPKALLQVGGQPLLVRLLRQLDAAGFASLAVVTGAHDSEIAAALAQAGGERPLPNFLRVTNSKWKQGVGTSVRAGVDALTAANPRLDGVLVTPVDLPCTQDQDWERLRVVFLDSKRTVAVAHGNQRIPGTPVLFTTSDALAMAATLHEGGAKAWLAENEGRIEVLEGPRLTWDADTPEALRALLPERSG